ncbi:CDP-diacylglycerol--glycerol-3-phosphate 3-phosphatidyltransferase [Salinisphaera sp. Q1T1-3]|uniref:CDP-diacylglycerol--glycerol-3-phosphate 3-phosphatidyltransferase n=1 Tax=Salinisphaera sp. Q1T1-3 TaxID=2321229 RepID=UPI000E70B576|nr:CDP-diacylglycerol--glycerol-3-phosphate 3-phosphatidyltransferase [Salinisphaera sp. Q1T1-3]
MNLPIWLTLFRLILIPFVIGLLFVPLPGFNIVAAILFGIALATDWLDGHLARRWNQTSAFGAFLDPVADKLIVCGVLVMLTYRAPHYYVALPATIIVGRELTVSALREWMAELGERGVVAVGSLGKYKTALQMLAIFMMLFGLYQRGLIFHVACAFLAVSAALTLWSMVLYLRQAWPRLSVEKS